MSDAELDYADDNNIIREHEEQDDVIENNQTPGFGDNDNVISDKEVKLSDPENNEQKDAAPVKKRGTRKLYVLNTERLKGAKGIHTIEKLYEGFQFHGKGHEKEDLDRVMKRLEYWAFRLFPKLDFDDFLAKCEHLGHKKDLHTHQKKYRLGMLSADDMIADDIDDAEKDDPEIARTESELLAQIADDNFQRLFDENVQATTELHNVR